MSKNQLQISQPERPSFSSKTTATRTQTEQSLTTKNNYYKKQDGSYGKETSKATHSSGAFGRGGEKDEYKLTNTYKVGNSKGYTEYYTEKRYRTVAYGNTSNNNKNTITYGNTSNYNNNTTIRYLDPESDCNYSNNNNTITYPVPVYYYDSDSD